MTSKTIAYGILRALAILGGITLLLVFLYIIQSVLIFIAIAAVISLIGRPVVAFLKLRLKFSDTFASVTTILFVITIIAGIMSLLIPVVISQSQHLAEIDFDKVRLNLNRIYGELAEYFGVSRMTIVEGIREADFIKNIDFAMIPRFLNSIIGNLGSAVLGIFSVIFISFFFLKDSRILTNAILAFSDRGEEHRFLTIFEKIKHLLSRYFIGLLIQVMLMFAMYAIVLTLFRVENALAVALFCATLNLVPYIGPLVGGALILLFTASGYLNADFQAVILPKITYVFIGYCIAQVVDNFFIQPYVFGSSVKSHPLEIFLTILIAGLLFGVIGMVIAIPTYTALKVIAKEFLSEYKIVKGLTRNL
ncbi:AI-2E family transporter [Croceiramulus getboli]|nr:AI-2E family transporter [Flavobacteriaceae bacterium YJPT1-3]